MKKKVTTLLLTGLALAGIVGLFWPQFSDTSSEATLTKSPAPGRGPEPGFERPQAW